MKKKKNSKCPIIAKNVKVQLTRHSFDYWNIIKPLKLNPENLKWKTQKMGKIKWKLRKNNKNKNKIDFKAPKHYFC